MRQPDDLARQAHELFSTACFNSAWELIDQPGRSAAEDERMVLLAFASLWHWTERPDCTDRERSIGCWQVARVTALAGLGETARHYGELCLRASGEQPPFYRAYAHEALARAARTAGDAAGLARHLAAARRLAAEVPDAGERGLVERDLATLS